jgi:hypothetical protein
VSDREHDDDRDDRDRPEPARELSEEHALSAMHLNYDEVVDPRMTFDDLIRLNAGRVR